MMMGMVLAASELPMACSRKKNDDGEAASMAITSQKRVELGPTSLEYFEDDNILRLTAELGSDDEGGFYIVYVPTAASWRREMPGWCKHRRDEILADIRRLTAKQRIKWVEED
jgi:hypothetical protein